MENQQQQSNSPEIPGYGHSNQERVKKLLAESLPKVEEAMAITEQNVVSVRDQRSKTLEGGALEELRNLLASKEGAYIVSVWKNMRPAIVGAQQHEILFNAGIAEGFDKAVNALIDLAVSDRVPMVKPDEIDPTED